MHFQNKLKITSDVFKHFLFDDQSNCCAHKDFYMNFQHIYFWAFFTYIYEH